MNMEIERISQTINEYNRLLNVIGEPGDVCKLSKRDISRLIGKSYTGTLKKLRFLEQNKLISQVPGGYIRTDKSLLNDTPLALLPKILLLVKEHPNIYYSFKQQAEEMSVPLNDVQTAWGFYAYFFGPKNPGG